MSDEINIGPALDAARATWAQLEGGVELAQKGRAEARAALEQGRPIFEAAGVAGWFDSSMVVLESAAAGAAAGSVVGPIGAVIGGAVGAVVAALNQPAVGYVTLRAQCTLADGSRVEVVNDPLACLCYERWAPLSPAEADAEFSRWYTIDRYGYGRRWDQKQGDAPSFGDEATARRWWSEHRRSDEGQRQTIIEQCLPRYSDSPSKRAAAQVTFGGRWGDRWYWNTDRLFGMQVAEIPAWVPVSQENVTRWFLIAAAAGLGPVDVERIAKLSDPRLGVARASQSLDELSNAGRRAAVANAAVLVLAQSGTVVAAALAGLAEVEATAARLRVGELDDLAIRDAWLRLADRNVALKPEASAKRNLMWGAAAVAVVALIVWRMNRGRRNRR